MDTHDDEFGAAHWAVTLLESGEGAVHPSVTRGTLREFVWWIAQDPEHYREFRSMVLTYQRVGRLFKGL